MRHHSASQGPPPSWTRSAAGPRLHTTVGRRLRRALLRALGRPIVCADCGRELFVAIPVVWRGELRLIGVPDDPVRISFRWTDALEFRHVELSECPAPERPWLR